MLREFIENKLEENRRDLSELGEELGRLEVRECEIERVIEVLEQEINSDQEIFSPRNHRAQNMEKVKELQQEQEKLANKKSTLNEQIDQLKNERQKYFAMIEEIDQREKELRETEAERGKKGEKFPNGAPGLGENVSTEPGDANRPKQVMDGGEPQDDGQRPKEGALAEQGNRLSPELISDDGDRRGEGQSSEENASAEQGDEAGFNPETDGETVQDEGEGLGDVLSEQRKEAGLELESDGEKLQDEGQRPEEGSPAEQGDEAGFKPETVQDEGERLGDVLSEQRKEAGLELKSDGKKLQDEEQRPEESASAEQGDGTEPELGSDRRKFQDEGQRLEENISTEQRDENRLASGEDREKVQGERQRPEGDVPAEQGDRVLLETVPDGEKLRKLSDDQITEGFSAFPEAASCDSSAKKEKTDEDKKKENFSDQLFGERPERKNEKIGQTMPDKEQVRPNGKVDPVHAPEMEQKPEAKGEEDPLQKDIYERLRSLDFAGRMMGNESKVFDLEEVQSSELIVLESERKKEREFLKKIYTRLEWSLALLNGNRNRCGKEMREIKKMIEEYLTSIQ